MADITKVKHFSDLSESTGLQSGDTFITTRDEDGVFSDLRTPIALITDKVVTDSTPVVLQAVKDDLSGTVNGYPPLDSSLQIPEAYLGNAKGGFVPFMHGFKAEYITGTSITIGAGACTSANISEYSQLSGGLPNWNAETGEWVWPSGTVKNLGPFNAPTTGEIPPSSWLFLSNTFSETPVDGNWNVAEPGWSMPTNGTVFIHLAYKDSDPTVVRFVANSSHWGVNVTGWTGIRPVRALVTNSSAQLYPFTEANDGTIVFSGEVVLANNPSFDTSTTFTVRSISSPIPNGIVNEVGVSVYFVSNNVSSKWVGFLYGFDTRTSISAGTLHGLVSVENRNNSNTMIGSFKAVSNDSGVVKYFFSSDSNTTVAGNYIVITSYKPTGLWS